MNSSTSQLTPSTTGGSRPSSASLCPECGSKLSGGACPACALGFLLHGSGDADPEVPEHRVEENVEFGRYTLKHKLAAGGMGVVYVAEDRKLKRTVALKMIRGSTFADDGEVARFTLEAEAAAGLDHPNIVPIYEVGRLDGQPFFTMKLIEGQTLAKRLKEHGGMLAGREVATLLSKIARAVHHAHQRGVLHRDLKPGNILLDGEGNPWLTDFGLAKVTSADSRLTLTKDYIGTPHYMAPEMAGGNARAGSMVSDVWALGVMLWEMLCGMPPFHGPGPVEIMRRIVTEEPSWPAGTRADGDLITVARRCMEKNPLRRPQSASEVADELERWLRGEPIKARRVTQRERFVKWVRRKPALAAFYVALGAGALAGLFLWQRAERVVVDLTKTNKLMEEALCVSTATRLAADAGLQVSEDTSRALLLAVASVEMTEKSGVLPEAASSLMSVLRQAGGLDASANGPQHGHSDAWIAFGAHDRRSATVSPDSRWMLSLDFSGSGKRPVQAAIFDLSDREHATPLRRWEIWPAHKELLRSSWRWLPDSQRILAAGGDGEVRIWEAVTPEMTAGRAVSGTPVSHLQGRMDLEGGKLESIHMIVQEGVAPGVGALFRKEKETRFCRWVITPDGQWQLRLNKLLEGPLADGAIARLSRDGRWLVLYSPKCRDRAGVISMDTPGEPLHMLTGLSNYPTDAVFSEDMKHLALLLADQGIRHFDLPDKSAAGIEIAGRIVPSQQGQLQQITLSPDNKWLAMTGSADILTLAPLDGSPEAVRLHLPGGGGWTVNFSASGRWLAAGGNQRVVHVWDMHDIRIGAPPLEFRGMPTPVGKAGFSPDETTVYATGMAGAVRRWPFDSASGSAMPRHYQAGTCEVTDVAVSPDNEWIASACGGVALPGEKNEEGFVTVSQIRGKGYRIAGNHANYASSVVFSRDGKWLASTGRDGEVKVWDFPQLTEAVTEGREKMPVPRFVFAVQHVRTHLLWRLAFHPDNRLYLAVGDGVLFSWDLKEKHPAESMAFQVIHSVKYLLPDVEVSPDGKTLAVARHGWDAPKEGNPQYGNQVLLYDLSGGSWPPVFRQALDAKFLQFTNISFSPDGRWLASGGAGQGATIWDLHARDIAASCISAPINAHLVSGVAFSPDSTRLAMGASDMQLHLWDWQRPGDIRSVRTSAGIGTLAWLQDGHLVSGGLSSKVTVWDTDLTRLKALARRIAGRELSAPERVRFRVPE